MVKIPQLEHLPGVRLFLDSVPEIEEAWIRIAPDKPHEECTIYIPYAASPNLVSDGDFEVFNLLCRTLPIVKEVVWVEDIWAKVGEEYRTTPVNQGLQITGISYAQLRTGRGVF